MSSKENIASPGELWNHFSSVINILTIVRYEEGMSDCFNKLLPLIRENIGTFRLYCSFLFFFMNAEGLYR